MFYGVNSGSNNSGRFKLILDTKEIAEINISNTGGWYNWKTILAKTNQSIIKIVIKV